MDDCPPTSKPDPAGQSLDRLKLLLVFDAVLVEGNLARAGMKLGKTPPMMSRMLRQLEEIYGQDLFERTAQGMIPTAFAEGLRPRLRALVAEANTLIDPLLAGGADRPPLSDTPPLALDQRPYPGMGPDSAVVARRIAATQQHNDPARRVAGYIATTGNNAGSTRPLTEAEAEDAFALMMSGDLPEVQIGALLSAIQTRGLTAPELAGFVRGARKASGLQDPGAGACDLDWPAYLSPRVQGAPYFIHSARLVARAGYRVMIHGPGDGLVRRAFAHADLPIGNTERPQGAGGVTFYPLEDFAPALLVLHRLYHLFLMPNASHMVSALMNPGAAATTLSGPRGRARPRLQLEAAMRLGWGAIAGLGGHRDAAQTTPGRAQDLLIWRDTGLTEHRLPNHPPPGSSRTGTDASDGMTRLEYWQAVWDGAVEDPSAETVVIDTAAVALSVLQPDLTLHDATAYARTLWSTRRKPCPDRPPRSPSVPVSR